MLQNHVIRTLLTRLERDQEDQLQRSAHRVPLRYCVVSEVAETTSF